LQGFSPPVHRFPFGSHIVLFKREETGVAIVRVFQARMDWRRSFEGG
jgi:plasmid stabilization system protein ParE